MPFMVGVRRELTDPEYYVEYLTDTNFWWSLEPIRTLKEARHYKKRFQMLYKEVRIIKRTSMIEEVK